MKTPLCKYRNAFGEPGSKTGLRKYRIFGIAVFDTLVALVCAFLIARFFHLPVIQTTVAIFLLGIIVHRVFCVRTAVDVMLFA
jgi:hypothetical protein